MGTLRENIREVIGNYLADWDKESSFQSQLDDLTGMVVEAVQEQPKSIPPAAVCFFKDGDAWCCVFGDFIDLQESPAGFGDSFDTALADLQDSHEKNKSRVCSELSSPPT